MAEVAPAPAAAAPAKAPKRRQQPSPRKRDPALGTLVQTKGTGASGSFKLNKKATETKKPAKKAAAPKAKKVVAKKPAAAKKPKKAVAKKPAAAAKKSPKKAKKPVTPKRQPRARKR
ncbi:hypothetical protein DPEC_G00377060 [Dallia pectoralis]|nr:hypothetical protein DPEC_G00377060 [Dallia pectoralis]